MLYFLAFFPIKSCVLDKSSLSQRRQAGSTSHSVREEVGKTHAVVDGQLVERKQLESGYIQMGILYLGGGFKYFD